MFFAGKGGVGKTTLAAAHALAQARAGLRVLAVSTAPAHSMGDVLGQRLSAVPRAVSLPHRGAGRHRTGSLDALELDGTRAFARWLSRQRAGLALTLEHGTWLDRADIDALLALPIPGIDELAGILEILRLSDARRFDILVVDTAPTGHTLRLLAAPRALESVSAALDALQAEHRLIRQQLARVGRADAADVVIARLTADAHDSGALLRNGRRTAFHWVMLPETLALAETGDGLRALKEARIGLACLVVNRVLPDGPSCPVCDARRAEETRVITRAVSCVGDRAGVRLVHEAPHEPRGVAALARIRLVPPPVPARQPVRELAARARYSVPAERRDGLRVLLPRIEGAHLVFVAGKGGVGKTTVAAALALELSRAAGDQRTLLLSTDPAHSLGDVLRLRAGDAPVRVGRAAPNLWVRELDATAALAARRAELDGALRELAETAGAGTDASRVAGLLDLAPPGLDELVGILSVLDARNDFGVVVIDMAPTGHALRLLQMPETAQAWVQALLRMLLKYRELVRPGQLASTLVTLSQSMRRLRETVADARLARVVLVTRAAAVPGAEASRLLGRLRRLRLAVMAVVFNARTMAPGTCTGCRRTAAAERIAMAAARATFRRRARSCAIVEAPLAAPPPLGASALRAWSRRWTT